MIKIVAKALYPQPPKTRQKSQVNPPKPIYADEVEISLEKFLEEQGIKFVVVEDYKIIKESNLFFEIEIKVDEKIEIIEFPKYLKDKLEKENNKIVVPIYKETIIADLVEIMDFLLLKEEFMQNQILYYDFESKLETKKILIFQYQGYKINVLKYILLSLIKEEILENVYLENEFLSVKPKELLLSSKFYIENITDDSFKKIFESYKEKKVSFENLLPERVISRFERKRKRILKRLEKKLKKESLN